MNREFELCCETLEACEAATAGGADRIELCTALDVGGVTPPATLLRAALDLTSLPVHVLVRPRGGLFVYDAREFALLCAQVEETLAVGAAGIVTGVLTPDGAIDLKRARELRRLAEGTLLTFHRAFDLTQDLAASLEQLIDLGYDRVLTSGGAANVVEGLPVLRQLAEWAGGRIRVAAGGGVRLENLAQIAAVPGLDAHGSLRRFDAERPRNAVAVEMGRGYRVAIEDVRAATMLFHTAAAG